MKRDDVAMIDKPAIRVAQSAYDWLLDEFGLCVGTLRCATLLVVAAMVLPDSPRTGQVVLTIAIGLSIARHEWEVRRQMRGDHKWLNAHSALSEKYQIWFRYAMLFFAAFALATGQYYRLVENLILWVYLTSLCIRTRDRERKWQTQESTV